MINMYEVMDIKDKKVYSLSELEDMFDKKHIDYKYVIKRLCCPSCEEEIITMKITEDYSELKSKRMKHKKDCDYYGFKISQSELKKKIKSGDGLSIFFTQSQYNKKFMPKKSISRRFSIDDKDVYKMFYGNVIVKEAYSKGDKYINYSFKAPRGDSFVVSFQNKHLDSNKEILNILKENVDKEINIKIIGNLRKVDEYYNILLEHPKLITMEKMLNV